MKFYSTDSFFLEAYLRALGKKEQDLEESLRKIEKQYAEEAPPEAVSELVSAIRTLLGQVEAKGKTETPTEFPPSLIDGTEISRQALTEVRRRFSVPGAIQAAATSELLLVVSMNALINSGLNVR